MRRSSLFISLLLALFLCGPAIIRGDMVGSPGAEVYGHAWVQTWTTAAWPALPAGTDLALGASSWPVIDPLPTWLIAGLGRLIGLEAAWNLRAVAAVVLAAVGGARLAAATGGAPMVGAVGLACAPIFLGSLTSGLTEDYALGLSAWALALLVEGKFVRGGLLIGLSAGCGLYLGWLTGLGALGVGLSKALQERRLPPRLLLGGLLAMGLAGAFALPFRARLESEDSSRFVPRPEPLWRLNPWIGADVASFFVPGKVEKGDALVREHPTYLGYVPLALAVVGGWHPAWLGLGAAMAVAPGEQLMFMGQPTGINNPAQQVFARLPFADRFHHHGRLMLFGQMALVVLAARGAQRWPRLAPALIAAEAALLSPATLPLPSTPTTSPDIYGALADLPDGPVLVYGAAGPGIPPQKVFFDQRAHGRPLLHDPNRPGPGKLRPGIVVVALGDAPTPPELGPPDRTTAGGRAWWIAPR